MNKKLTLLVFLLLVSYASSYAQYNLKENNVWAFGHHAGLDFNSGTATPIQSAIDYNAGGAVVACATVCDTAGHLLFYSSGDTIYNKNNQVMDGGYGLMSMSNVGGGMDVGGGFSIPCSTMIIDTVLDTVQDVVDTTYDTTYALSAMGASQGSLIMPVLNNPNQYYVFSLQRLCIQDAGAGRLFYSVVDMSLNGGLGGVVPTQKAILLDSALSQQMIAIPGDNCDIWLMVHGNQNDTFKAYNITIAGINPTPVLSAVGNISGVLSYSIGTMNISPNRRKLAASSVGYFALGGVGAELYDFDPATGVVSNAVTIGTDAGYGLCFSPDNSKFYLNHVYMDLGNGIINTYLSQFDISLPTTTDILNSRVDVSVDSMSNQIKDLRLGPDGKIYLVGALHLNDTDVLHVINNPNAAGTACQFAPFAITLNAGTFTSAGLPNMYMKPLRDTIFTTTDTSMVLTSNLTLQIPSGYFNYLWNDGSTDSDKVITDTGTYWVKYGNYCTYRTDTFVVRQSTGIMQVNGVAAASLTVYPSPTRDVANVAIRGLSKVDGALQLIDMVGRTVLEQTCGNKNQTLNVSNIAPGVYTVLYTDKGSSMQLHQQLVITK